MRRSSVVALTALASLAAAACIQEGALAPKGPNAELDADLFYISFWTALVVATVTLALLGFALFRRHRDRERDFPAMRFVVIGGLLVPSLVLIGMMITTFYFLGQQPQGGEMEIRVVGHQFWWEVYYPAYDFETANEIHIPVGVQVELVLESDDVIHSFWVPEISGKADLVPGRTNRLSVTADEPGVYRGHCAEYCGIQHAQMAFIVIAEDPQDFEEWARQQARPVAVANSRGEEIFSEHACAGCHAVRGTDAEGELGPDLTHLASRTTIAAGTLPLTEGHLSGWVVNSQTIKPGNEMPPITTLSPEELEILIHYLLSLE